jgi:hypothetical protein
LWGANSAYRRRCGVSTGGNIGYCAPIAAKFVRTVASCVPIVVRFAETQLSVAVTRASYVPTDAPERRRRSCERIGERFVPTHMKCDQTGGSCAEIDATGVVTGATIVAIDDAPGETKPAQDRHIFLIESAWGGTDRNVCPTSSLCRRA